MKVTDEYSISYLFCIVYSFGVLFTEVYDPHPGNLTQMNNPILCKHSESEMQDPLFHSDNKDKINRWTN